MYSHYHRQFPAAWTRQFFPQHFPRQEKFLYLGRRFRSIKLWFTFRTFGVNAFQKHIRTSIQMADYFANLVTSNDNFELFRPQSMGLVCFRAKGSNDQNKELLARLNGTREIHLTPSEIDETYFLRLAICSTKTTYKDLDKAFELNLKHFKDLRETPDK